MRFGYALSTRKPQFLYHSVLLRPQGTQLQREHGTVETIVVMHGLLGCAKNFMSVVKMLQKLTGEPDIVVLDLVSHGRSAELGDLQLHYRSMGEDVLYTLQRLNLDKSAVHLIGHSMGGKVAAAACLLSEARGIDVRSATILDISPIEYTEEEFESVFGALDFLEESHEGIAEGRVKTKKDLSQMIDTRFEDKSFGMFLNSNILVDENNDLKWRFSVPGIAQSRKDILGWPFEPEETFEKPLLLLKGGDSSFVKTAHLERIKPHFPLYTLQSLKGAGHWLHAEKPEETAQRIGDFIGAARDWHTANRDK